MVAMNGPYQMRRNVLYLGSAVPLETSEGLEAIQQPLKERYPVHDDKHVHGIDAYLSVLPGGLQLEYKQDPETVVWFPISSLTLCAAVRCIHIVNGATGEKLPKFVSLGSPAALGANAHKPSIFTAITRRTVGKKVLECHGFVCSSPQDALDLVAATKSTGYRHRSGRYASYPHTDRLPNGSAVLRNESFSSHSSYNSPKGGLRLVPGSPVARKDDTSSEFFEPPPSQGYFYTGGGNHVRSFTLSRVPGESGPNPTLSASEHPSSTLPMRPRRVFSPPPPPSKSQPVYYGPGRAFRPPMPQSPPTSPRRRFFSPPPAPSSGKRYGYGLLNRGRDPHVFMPPPPIFVDSPYGMPLRPVARGGSISSGESRSGSPSPTRHNETSGSRGRHRSSSGSSTLRRDGKHHHHHHHHHAINGQGATESSSEVSSRPRTPEPEYATVNRMSRKDRHENQRYRKYRDYIPSPDEMLNHRVYPGYYFYGYPTNSQYVRVARPRSLPPPMHAQRSPSRRVKKDKSKKKKKKKKQQSHSDDMSTDSFENRSDVPTSIFDRSFPNVPRDWRNNQFKNEKALSKTILGSSRRGYFSDATPSAYALNQTRDGPQGDLGFD